MDDKDIIKQGMAQLVRSALVTESNIVDGNIKLIQSMMEKRLKAVKHSLEQLPAMLRQGNQPVEWELNPAPGSIIPFIYRSFESQHFHSHDMYAQVSVFVNGFITIDLKPGLADYGRITPSQRERYNALQAFEDEVIQWAIYFNWRNIAISVPFVEGRRWLVFGADDENAIVPEDVVATPVGLSNVPMLHLSDEELHVAYVANPDYTPNGETHHD